MRRNRARKQRIAIAVFMTVAMLFGILVSPVTLIVMVPMVIFTWGRIYYTVVRRRRNVR